MTYEMSVVDVPEMRVIAIRGTHRREDVPRLHRHRIRRPVRSPRPARHARRRGPRSSCITRSARDGVDADVCVPVAGPVDAGGRIETHVLPPCTCVRTLHVGPYAALSGAYTELSEWVDDHAFRPEGPVRERYLNGPGDTTTPGEYRTEIEMPVAPVHATEPALAGR